MRLGRGARGIVLGVVLCAGLPAQVGLAQTPPSAEVKAGARAAAERGSTEFQAGHYKEALDLFQRAESLFHATTHLLMIGRTYAAMGQLVQAKEVYLKAIHEELAASAPPAFKRAQGECEKELGDIEPRIPSVQITVAGGSPSNLAVTMDGAPVPAALVGIPHPVDPGAHAFRAAGDGFLPAEIKLEVKEGQKASVRLELKPAPLGMPMPPQDRPAERKPPADAAPASSKRIASFALMGVGAAGIGVGAAFAALYSSKRGEANAAFDKCGMGCSGAPADNVRALDSNANTKGTVAVVGFVAGGLLAAGGVTLFVLSRPAAPRAAGATVAPWLGAGSAGVSGAF